LVVTLLIMMMTHLLLSTAELLDDADDEAGFVHAHVDIPAKRPWPDRHRTFRPEDVEPFIGPVASVSKVAAKVTTILNVVSVSISTHTTISRRRGVRRRADGRIASVAVCWGRGEGKALGTIASPTVNVEMGDTRPFLVEEVVCVRIPKHENSS
jgi:hypothetical protein